MLIAVDFDATVVQQGRPYSDLQRPLLLVPGAKSGLVALRAAEHTLFLCSSRANLALRLDWQLNPLWRAFTPAQIQGWEASREFHEARYQQMLQFVPIALPGIFAAVDDGRQGKVLADLFIDDKAQRFGARGLLWEQIAATWGVQT